ncbi:hypothetical protein EGW08_017141 [Elysia chlorotica]|uniref:Uncharacterized protein n=1 Tax=Elysia chlorotica TaxID=188477 RepID=A0A3S0ZDB5_ELYCH|nr:hypothetical protein EGW08_017141 [Elysia chlorotica]
MVAYSEAACGRAYNLAIQDIDPERESNGAILYDIPFNAPLPEDREQIRFKPETTISSFQRPQVKVKASQVKNVKQSENTDSARNFLYTVTPYALFLLAICLKIPHLVWTLLTTLVGGINIGQTLASAKAGTGLSSDGRRQLYNELAGATVEKIRACSWSASSLYLLLKISMCLAVIVDLVVVHKRLLPQAQALGQDLKAENENVDVMGFADSALNATTGSGINNSTEGYIQPPATVLNCELPIRQVRGVNRHFLQCSFEPETEDVNTPNSAMLDQTPNDDQVTRTLETALQMNVALFLIVQTYLAALTVVNVSSFLVWLLKLVVRPCTLSVDSGLDLPVDARLLLYMAQENAGPEAVKFFSQAEVWGREEVTRVFLLRQSNLET